MQNNMPTHNKNLSQLCHGTKCAFFTMQSKTLIKYYKTQNDNISQNFKDSEINGQNSGNNFRNTRKIIISAKNTKLEATQERINAIDSALSKTG